MFKKLKRQYFGKRPVEGVVEDPAKNRVIVTFSDNKLPKQEEMHMSEWEDGKSDAAIEKPDELQEWWVKRSQKRRQAVLDTLISFNPRFADMKKDASWLAESLAIVYRDLVNKVFGYTNFDTEATINDVAVRYEKENPDFTKEWSPIQKDIFALIRKYNVKFYEIDTGLLLTDLNGKISNMVAMCVAEALGGTDEARRCSDMERLIEQYTKKKE